MCFDICTINIRVSIRVRGLHLVFKYDGVKDSSCVCQIGFQSAKILNRLRHVLKAEEGEKKRKRSQKISEIHSFTASPFAFCSHPEVCCKDLDYSGDTDARSEKWEVVYPADHPVIRSPGASWGILWHESGSESTGRRRVGIEHRKSIENRLWKSIEGTCFNRFFNGKKNLLNTTASHSRHSIIHWSMESIPSLHHSMIWCRRLCDDLDLKEISMPRSFFWDDWTNTQDEKHILNLLEDGTLKLASQNHMRFTSCWNMLKPYVPDFQGKG